MILGLPSLTPTFYNPALTIAPQVLERDNMGVSLGNAAAGAANGASIGSLVPGWGTAIGGIVGGVAGLFTKPKTAAATPAATSGGSFMPSLTDALSLGLGSLGRTSGAAPVTVNQSQTVGQDTNINLTNIIGAREFGGADLTTGEFDVFKTISDVFAIRDAQAALENASPSPNTSRPSGVISSGNSNYSGLLLIGALAVGAYLLIKKGK